MHVHVRVSPGAWNASEQTGHISPTRSFVLLNAAHLSQQRPAEIDKRWAKAPLNGLRGGGVPLATASEQLAHTLR